MITPAKKSSMMTAIMHAAAVTEWLRLRDLVNPVLAEVGFDGLSAEQQVQYRQMQQADAEVRRLKALLPKERPFNHDTHE